MVTPSQDRSGNLCVLVALVLLSVSLPAVLGFHPVAGDTTQAPVHEVPHAPNPNFSLRLGELNLANLQVELVGPSVDNPLYCQGDFAFGDVNGQRTLLNAHGVYFELGREPSCSGPGHIEVFFEPEKPVLGQTFTIVARLFDTFGTVMNCVPDHVLVDWTTFPIRCPDWLNPVEPLVLEKAYPPPHFEGPPEPAFSATQLDAATNHTVCVSQEFTFSCPGVYALAGSAKDSHIYPDEPPRPADVEPQAGFSFGQDGIADAKRGVAGRQRRRDSRGSRSSLPKKVGGLRTTEQQRVHKRDTEARDRGKRFHVVPLQQDPPAAFLLSLFRVEHEFSITEPLAVCDSTSCCALAADCAAEIAETARHAEYYESPTSQVQVAAVRDPAECPLGQRSRCSLCPHPSCAFGYYMDPLSGFCVLYRSSARVPIRHTPYQSMGDCIRDYSRNTNSDWCTQPLERSFKACYAGHTTPISA